MIYPEPIFSKGPPPGISIHNSISYSLAGEFMNSRKEPQESAKNAPNIHPKALSSNVFSSIYLSIFKASFDCII